MGKVKKPDESPETRALAEVAAQRFNRYKEVFAPLEDQYIADVFAVRNPANYEQAGGLATAAYQQEFQKANENLAGQMFQQGVDPTSGAFQENSAALRRAAAVKQGLGVGTAKIENTNRFYQGLQGIIQMGQGQTADAISGMGNIATNAEERARTNAAAAFDRGSALRSGVAAGIGYVASPFVDRRMSAANPAPAMPTTPKTGG